MHANVRERSKNSNIYLTKTSNCQPELIYISDERVKYNYLVYAFRYF